MDKITVTLPSDTVRQLDDRVGSEYDSRSEAVRELLDQGFRYEDRVTELERENERLQRERRQLLEQREENQQLVKFAQEQRSVVREQRERDREKESANMFRRAWWFVAGRPSPDSETSDG